MGMKGGEIKKMNRILKYAIYALIGMWIGLHTAKSDTISLILENDTLSFPKKDESYTHGTEIKYMIEKQFWTFDNYGFSVQQNMYGPKLDKTDNMKQGEHPYCGYLAFNFIGEQWLNNLSLNHQIGFGCVGSHTYAEQTQRYIHKVLGCKDPKGWKKWQIRDEFTVQYQMYANWNVELFDVNQLNGYLIPRIGIEVGGFKDMCAIGLDFKFGLNAPMNSGSEIILSAPLKKKKDVWSLFAKVGVEGRCVFHDTAIEGGFFRDSPYTLDAETFVGEFHWGTGLEYKSFEIAYSQFIRTKEYETNYRRPNYGQLLLKYEF